MVRGPTIPRPVVKPVKKKTRLEETRAKIQANVEKIQQRIKERQRPKPPPGIQKRKIPELGEGRRPLPITVVPETADMRKNLTKQQRFERARERQGAKKW